MLRGIEEDIRSLYPGVQVIIENQDLVGYNGGRLGCEVAVSQ
jgi:hypothetical protein